MSGAVPLRPAYPCGVNSDFLPLYDGLHLETVVIIVISYHENVQNCVIRIFICAFVQL